MQTAGPGSESRLSTDSKPLPCSNGRDQIRKTPPTHNSRLQQCAPTHQKSRRTSALLQPANVMGKAMTTQPDRQNRVLFDILYLSNCLNKQIDYLCTMDNISCIRQQADIKQINRCKDRVLELNGSFDYLSNGLELAGNNVRLKILFLLYEEQQLCVCDLSDILGMTISAISQHLRKLKDRKLIETERQAQTIFYSLTKEYEKMLKPFFKILHENKILETI